MIHGAEAHTDLYGNTCDDWGACDAYVKLFIDGKEVYRTECCVNTHMPYFGEQYRSPRMHKSARITIEMWDEDSGWLTGRINVNWLIMESNGANVDIGKIKLLPHLHGKTSIQTHFIQ